MSYNDGARIAHLLISYLESGWRTPRDGMVWCVIGLSRWASCGGWRTRSRPPMCSTGCARVLPGAEVIELSGVGHYSQVEVPDAFARGALRILDQSR